MSRRSYPVCETCGKSGEFYKIYQLRVQYADGSTKTKRFCLSHMHKFTSLGKTGGVTNIQLETYYMWGDRIEDDQE